MISADGIPLKIEKAGSYEEINYRYTFNFIVQ